MRLIDADKVLDGVINPYERISISRWLDDAQTVDAVPVVRCKDCKNSEHWYRDRRRCFLWSEDGVSVFDDGFCNYAERKK